MLRRTPVQRAQARMAAHALWAVAPVFRAALTEGIAAHACRRLGRDPRSLHRWNVAVPPQRPDDARRF